jgi:hypothetical protein
MKTKLFLTLAGVMFGLHITAQEVQQGGQLELK